MSYPKVRTKLRIWQRKDWTSLLTFKMIEEDLDRDFKDTEHPFRLVFLCAMWMTGFDVPNCSTIYLDKPLRNHTLMQTIARANRVYAEKSHGLIVDYVGVFRNLNKALAIYGADYGGSKMGGLPVKSKAALVGMLTSAVNEAEKFLNGVNVSIPKILDSSGFERIAILDDAVEKILVDDQHKMTYQYLSSSANRIWKAILPDSQASKFTPRCVVLKVLKEKSVRSRLLPTFRKSCNRLMMCLILQLLLMDM